MTIFGFISVPLIGMMFLYLRYDLVIQADIYAEVSISSLTPVLTPPSEICFIDMFLFGMNIMNVDEDVKHGP